MPLDPYKIEFKRQNLASKKDLINLRKLYKKKFPEIKNINTASFWDKKFDKESRLCEQDSMTQNRVRAAIGFVPRGKLKILDIGAGMGFTEEILSVDKNKEIYANDFSTISVMRLKDKFRGDFRIQSIYGLKYPQHFFDVVMLLEVLEHIPPSKVFSVLKSVNNILNSSGRLIVSVPMNEGLEKMEDNPSGHVRMYTKDLISAELKIAGFEVEKYKTLFAFGDFYRLKTFIARLFSTHKPNNIVLKAIKK